MTTPQQTLADRLEKLIATDSCEDALTIGVIVCANAPAILAALRAVAPASLIKEHARVAEGVDTSNPDYFNGKSRCEAADAGNQDAGSWTLDSAYGRGRSDAAKAIRATAKEHP
jgi:hypothetical protein